MSNQRYNPPNYRPPASPTPPARRGVIDIDNRTSSDVDDYQQARIEALTRRVRELELEVATLKKYMNGGK